MDKRAQAALEFLTTYGWAILVILVMIGALVYFGLLNPTKALPNRCEATAGFACKDFQITEDGFEIQIYNKLGETIKDVDFTDLPDSDEFISALVSGDCGVTGIVPADDLMIISCNHTDLYEGLGASQGVKVKIAFDLNYTMIRGTYPKVASISVYGPVQ
ncbi:hypothetical protein JW711_00370 [Candidatus Woesearchaeota archaeon]|nr:hypothetical protein [Candidatus Woesearchaeota archaeon]